MRSIGKVDCLDETQGTHVLVILTRTGDQEKVLPLIPDEIRAEVQLYLDGKVERWFARRGGQGAVFLLNCRTVDEARGLMEALPLFEGGYVEYEYLLLGPLPLGVLL